MGTSGILRRPAVPPPVRVRRSIQSLIRENPTHPVLLFYSRAIGEMKKGVAEIPPGSGRRINVPGGRLDDPKSWRYQAAIHDYPPNDSTLAGRRRNPAARPFPFFDADPFAIDQEPMPSASDRARFWRACQHNSWFFLPWHRMYLHFFEKIVLSHVIDLKGPKDWALPYWNYSAPPGTPMGDEALVPEPFRNPTIAGETNHLFVAERVGPTLDPGRGANAGGRFLTPDLVSLVGLRRSKTFRDAFGGPPVPNHPGNVGNPGSLEGTPHNNVHSSLGGGNGGFMIGFSTAPLDPLFWMHHCNIDRLWEVWVQRQKRLKDRNRNPNPIVADGPLAQRWLDQGFDFHDANGNEVSPPMKVKDVLNSRIPPLSYEYEDTSDPFKGAT